MIKLTQRGSGNPVWVNPHWIASMRWWEDHTVIVFGSDDETLEVKEEPAEILRALAWKEEGEADPFEGMAQ